MSIRTTVARNTGFNAAGRLWEALVTLVLTRYIVDAVGVPAFGVWALVSVFTGYVALADFGVGSAYVKYIAEHAARDETDEISAIVSTGTLFYLVLGLLLLAAGWPCVSGLVWLFERFGMLRDQAPGDLRFLLRGGLLLFAATNLCAAFTSIQGGLQRMGLTTVLSFAASLIKIAATVAFLETGHGVRGLLYANAISFAVFAASSVYFAFRLVPGLHVGAKAVTMSALRRLVHFGIRAQVAKLSNLVLFETDLVVAGLVRGAFNYTGLYQIGVALANKMRQFPVMLLSALVPAASDLNAREDHERLQMLYLVSSKYVAALAIPLALYTAGCAGPLIRAWMGDKPGLEVSVLVLRIIAAGYIANIIPGAGVTVALGKGLPGLQMKAGIIATVSNLVLTVALVLTIGFWGIPLGTALSLYISWAWFAHAMAPVVDVTPGRLLRTAVVWPLLASLPGLALCVLCDIASRGTLNFAMNLGAAAAGLAAFAVTYLALIRLMPFLDDWDLDFLEHTVKLGRVPGWNLWTRRMKRV